MTNGSDDADALKSETVVMMMRRFTTILQGVLRTTAEQAVADENLDPALVTQALYGALALELGYTDGLAAMLGVPPEGRESFKAMNFEEGKSFLAEALSKAVGSEDSENEVLFYSGQGSLPN